MARREQLFFKNYTLKRHREGRRLARWNWKDLWCPRISWIEEKNWVFVRRWSTPFVKGCFDVKGASAELLLCCVPGPRSTSSSRPERRTRQNGAGPEETRSKSRFMSPGWIKKDIMVSTCFYLFQHIIQFPNTFESYDALRREFTGKIKLFSLVDGPVFVH